MYANEVDNYIYSIHASIGVSDWIDVVHPYVILEEYLFLYLMVFENF
jgi:hypothetical protein